MSGMILSKVIEDGDEFFNIEDAQTRLGTLEDFYNDRFRWDTEGNEDYGDSVRFSDLDRHLQRRFENYTINFEVIKNATAEDTHEIFERLQEGEPLRNKDKYWNRGDSQLVSYAMALTREEYWRDEYMGTSRPITDANRNRLPDVCAFVAAHVLGNHFYTPSFNKVGPYLTTTITDEHKARIESFLEYYNEILDEAYSRQVRAEGERMKPYYNIAKDLGLILFDWSNNPDNREASKSMWIDIINMDRRSPNFMKGSKSLWNGMSSSDKQNTFEDSFRARLARVREFYENQEAKIKELSIEVELN